MSDTDLIEIEVQTDYLESESIPAEDRYVFAYTITIHNHSPIATRLLARHWVITDAHGRVQEVHGEGVVGVMPNIEPGKAFRYTSAAVIGTPVGTMEGEYRMRNHAGDLFDARIPAFTLAVPNRLH